MDLRAQLPDLHLDLRYAGPDNFVGMPIDGYHAPKCLLLPAVAEALVRVEQALRAQSLRLTVFDCYRPQRAVNHFMRWARDPADQRTKPLYYPRLDKSALVGDYIAERSGHSRGDTLDVGLLSCTDAREAASCSVLDMGTRFDFFDPRAHTDSPEVTPAQRANRHRLRAAMAAEGFANYAREWWHYSRRDPAAPAPLRDEPIR